MALDRFIVFIYPWLAAAGLAWAAASWLRGYRPRKLGARAAAAVACSIAVYLGLRSLAPIGPIVYISDYEYVDVAANLARSGAFAHSWAKSEGWTVLKPAACWAGYEVALAALFRATGASPRAALGLNAALGALCVVASSLLAWELLEDEAAACMAGLFAAVLPPLPEMAGSTGPSVAAFLAILLSLLAFARWRRRPGPASHAILWSTLAAAAFARPENLLFSLALGAAAHRLSRRRAATSSAVEAAALLLCLASGVLAWRNRLVGQDLYDATAASALVGLRDNLAGDLAYLAGPRSPQLLLAPLTVFGLAAARRRGLRVEAAVFCGVSVLLLLFVAAGAKYDFFFWNGAKHALPVEAGLLPFAALGAALAAKRARKAWTAAALGAALALSWTAVRDHEARLSGQRERDALLAAASGALPADALVLTHNPASVLVRAERPAVDARLAVEGWDELKRRSARSTLVLFRDFWAPTQPETDARLESLVARDFSAAALLERRLGGRTYGFYRLEPKR